MAESMRGLHRSHRCTEVSSANIGETVTVMADGNDEAAAVNEIEQYLCGEIA